MRNENIKNSKKFDKLKKYEEKIRIIAEDMMSFITHIPDREADILAFMEQYQKSGNEQRPEILENLRSCMDGKSYPNPYERRYHYTAEDVKKCEEILNEYIKNISEKENTGEESANKKFVCECIKEVTVKLNGINESCGRYLIDTWRREKLCELINEAAEEKTVFSKEDMTIEYRMW